MQRMGGGSRYTRKQRAGGNDPSCGCDMQAGWPKFLTENIPLPSVGPSLRVGSPEAALTQPTQKGGASCGIPPIPNYYNGRGMSGGGCATCSGLPLPQPLPSTTVGPSQPTIGGGQPTVYNSNPVPDACPFPGTGYCGFYARGGFLPNHEGGANYGEPMYLQARLRGGANTEWNKQLTETMAKLSRSGKTLNYRQLMYFVKSLREKSPNVLSMSNAEILKEYETWTPPKKGGGCGCGLRRGGGYRPTKKNRAALKKWRKGQSIGFTQTASLKAKGLIPRTSVTHKGKKVVSAKYK
jgi:hypothetical protein